jgi:hypothetical protein
MVHAARPWYWRVLIPCVAAAGGYALAYWQFSSGEYFQSAAEAEQVQALVTQLVSTEHRLQVERSAQSNAAKEMAALQGEIMQLKEDVAFYKGILEESGTAGVARLHSIKLVKGARTGEYRYQILLVQSGRHDRMVQGKLQLTLQAVRDGKSVISNIEPDSRQQKGAQVNFKYYQRIEGMFSVPAGMQGRSLQVDFTESGGKRARLSQTVHLPT